jgi:mRNA-degrading endonuclease RelE of RelBE toxin-antitoxin system
VRLPNLSTGRGKSGGFRVVYYVETVDGVVLLTMYAKSEQQDVSRDEIRRLIEDYLKASE